MEKTPQSHVEILSLEFLRLAVWLLLAAGICWGVMYLAGETLGGDGVFFSFWAMVILTGLGYCWLMFRQGWRVLILILPLLILQCGGFFSIVNYFTRPETHTGVCRSNMAQAALAIQIYSEVHGNTLPPAYQVDEAGIPLSSWRVSVLPFAEREDLYHKFDFNQPWDSEDNFEVSKQRIKHFQCPVLSGREIKTPNHTSYVAVVGPETAWPGSTGRILSEITDPHSETILLVEIAAIDHPWAAPDTTTLVELMELLEKGSEHGPSSRHVHRHQSKTVNVVFVDGSRRSLPVDLPSATWRALFTINGAEKITLPEAGLFDLKEY